MDRRLCTWLLAGLLYCAPGFALDRLQVDGYLLPNGLQVLLKAGDNPGHVAIRLVVGVGFDDFACSDKELPHLLEHLLFSGIDASGEGGLETRIQSLGGDWNAYTSDTDTTFVIEAPASNQRKVLDLLLSMLTQTRIDQAALDLAKRIVQHEDGGHTSHLQRLLDHPGSTEGAGSRLATELGLRCEEPSDIASLTLEQVQRVRQQWYAPNNMSLIVVGQLNKFLPAHLDRTYGELKPVEPSDHQPLLSISRQPPEDSTLRRGWLGETAKLHAFFVEPALDEVPPPTLDLVQSYLDWALYQNLRLQQGLSYGPWSQREAFGDSSLFSLNADLDRDDLPAARQAIQQMLERLKHDGLDAATFERLKQQAIAQQAWASQGNSALADFYWGALTSYNDNHFADPAAGLRDVTLADANQAMRALFEQPPYWRSEQPWLGYDQAGWAAAATVLLLLTWLALTAWAISAWREAKR